MTSTVYSRPIDDRAVDLAWVRLHAHELSRVHAIHDMMAAGLHYPDAKRAVADSAMPSNGLLAVAR